VALLHEIGPEITHGALAAERILVTPGARITIVEHVMGSAIEQLRFSRERYWKDLRIALPHGAGAAKFDHRADVTQLGAVALSLVLGRPLLDDESPSRLGNVVASAWAVSARGGLEPLPAGLRAWLTSALQLDPRNSFASAVEAQAELERVLGENDYVAAPATLESFLAQYHATRDPVAAAAVSPPPPVAQPQPVAVVNLVAVPAPAVSHVAAAAPAASSRPLALPTPAPPSVVKLQPAPRQTVFPPAPLDTLPIHHDAVTPREPRKGWPLAAAQASSSMLTTGRGKAGSNSRRASSGESSSI
jgi:hypothetical protein